MNKKPAGKISLCAWCATAELKHEVFEFAEKTGLEVTHGICAACKEQMEAKIRGIVSPQLN